MIAVAQTKSIFEFAFEFFIKVAEPKKGFYLNLYPQKKFQIKIIKFLIEFQKACLPPSFIKIFLSKKIEITENSLDQLKTSIQNITNSDQSIEVMSLNKKIEEFDLGIKNILMN